MIADGGNVWYPNSIRRGNELQTKGIMFVGMGISGGEEGARNGPSLMPGGPREAYDELEPILTRCAAQVRDGACSNYVGPIGSGNYVKMVHNGIEYGDMQLIAEAYDIMRNVAGMGNNEISKVFQVWNNGPLESYLIEITAAILAKTDDITSKGNVVDYVLDKTGMKGTGKWTIQEAAEVTVAAPTISGSLNARFLSGIKDERVKASNSLNGPTKMPPVDKQMLIDKLGDALYASKICSYAQGLGIIKAASDKFNWNIDLAVCVKLWRGGCIIRAKVLDKIQAAFLMDPSLPNLMLDSSVAIELGASNDGWREVVITCAQYGIACPSISGSLSYYDSYRTANLPANLTQAQRDFFGGHTYERIDQPGSHHSKWTDAHKDIGNINERNQGDSTFIASSTRETVMNASAGVGIADVGLYGLAVMGQNFALNMASHGFVVCVGNRSPTKVAETVNRGKREGNLPIIGSSDPEDFIMNLQKPRKVVLLVQAGKPVDMTISALSKYMEPGDIIVDGGNEWYPNSVRRGNELQTKGIMFVGMGISGGEEGARNGPSLMPGGPREAYDELEPILTRCAAQVRDGACSNYVGPIGSGNYVKMVHNGIEYGDMQLIAEAYDIMRNVVRMGNNEISKVFQVWNNGPLESYLIEITAAILAKTDDITSKGNVVDYVLDKTGMKGTGKWTIQEAAEVTVAAPTISGSLNARFLSGIKDERVKASNSLNGPTKMPGVDKQMLIDKLGDALYASKICSYAQGLGIIKAASDKFNWNIDLAVCVKLWRGGCIIRAKVLDKIQAAFLMDPSLPNLMLDSSVAK